MPKLRVGILGATGVVGQRLITLLEGHPWFEVTAVAASPRSAGKPYREAVKGRWSMRLPIPTSVTALPMRAVREDLVTIAGEVDFVFCALDLDTAAIQQLEVDYATSGIPVVSNNSAHRWTKDVPILMPEINPGHVGLLDIQRQNRNWSTGLIAVKPNCSIQSYVSVLSTLQHFEPSNVMVTSLQAISGAGKTFDDWPEMIDNVMPFIQGEEEKSEHEPLKIWGTLENGNIQPASSPYIRATCLRVPISDGHLAAVTVQFKHHPTKKQILDAVANYANPLIKLGLPSAPKQFITYLEEPDRPQIKLDRESGNGMGITMGRLREDPQFGWQFIALAHNTIRGAAGGAVLMAELLVTKGYIQRLHQ